MLLKRFGKKKNQDQSKQDHAPHQTVDSLVEQNISTKLVVTHKIITDLLSENGDFTARNFLIFGEYPAVMYYFSNLVEQSTINTELLKPLMYIPEHLINRTIDQKQLKNILLNEVLYHSEARLESKIEKLIEALLSGETLIVVNGLDEAIHVDTRAIEKRSIDSPQTEQVIQGPREGFIELLGTNLSLLRYRLPTPDLCIKTMKIGRISKAKVAICYLKGIANETIVEEVKKRLSKIDVDFVFDVGNLEQFIEDNHYSPFPQVQSTERPDKTAASLAEGKVAILLDGSPFSLIVPVVFNAFYQTSEDYSNRFLMGSFVRIARILALIFSLVFPSIYVSFISFNPELLPTEFAVAVAGGRAGVPFPAVIEVLMMEVSMEVLREATVRLPQQVGGALSIVGVLVIGEAAVNAGLASPITVVVIAITTIGSFATPAYSAAFALRMLRFPLVVLAGIFGLYGVVVGIIFIFNHMFSLKSFGVPFMSPVAPGNAQGMKDVVFRGPLWWMTKRPSYLHPYDRNRIGEETKKTAKQKP